MSKPLIKVYGKPIMRYLVERLNVDVGCDKIYVIYYAGISDFRNGPLQVSSEELKENIFYNLGWDDIITYVPIYTVTGGVLETLHHGMQNIILDEENTTVILDCDIFYGMDILEVIRREDNRNCNMLFYFVDDGDKPEYSYIEVDTTTTVITKIYEKHRISDHANAGVYVFQKWRELSCYLEECLSYCHDLGKEPYLSFLVTQMIRHGHVFHGFRLEKESVYNLGTPERIVEFKENRLCFLFDLDGTMILSDHVYFKVWNKILQEFHMDLSMDLYKKNIQGNSDCVVKSRFCLPYSVNQLSRQKDLLFEMNSQDITLIEGITELLRECFWNAIPVVIVTNCNRPSAEMIISKMGFEEYIHGLVIGGECDHPKPAGDPYRYAIETILDANPKDCVIFEDSKTGLLSASCCHVGMVVGIQTSYDESSLKKLGCDYTLTNFSGGVAMIKQQFDSLLVYKNESLDSGIDNIKTALVHIFPNTIIHVSNYKLKGGFISDVICFRVYERFNYILKMENKSDNPIRAMAGQLDLYNTEYYFYSVIAPTLSVSIPKSFGIVQRNGIDGIILEDMFSKGNVIHDSLDKMPISIISIYIDTLAELHLTYWGLDVKNIFPRVRSPGEHDFSWSEFISGKWVTFYDRWNFMMSDEMKKTCTYIVDNFDEIEKYMCKGQRTLCHGDFKAPNIFFHNETRKCTLIDWQYVTFGKGTQDLVFFMIESFDISNMTISFKEYMLSYYYLLIHQKHAEYEYEEFRRDVQMSSYYFPFFVAVWFGTIDIDNLLDKNFPFFFIQRLFHFYELN